MKNEQASGLLSIVRSISADTIAVWFFACQGLRLQDDGHSTFVWIWNGSILIGSENGDKIDQAISLWMLMCFKRWCRGASATFIVDRPIVLGNYKLSRTILAVNIQHRKSLKLWDPRALFYCSPNPGPWLNRSYSDVLATIHVSTQNKKLLKDLVAKEEIARTWELSCRNCLLLWIDTAM